MLSVYMQYSKMHFSPKKIKPATFCQYSMFISSNDVLFQSKLGKLYSLNLIYFNSIVKLDAFAFTVKKIKINEGS